MAPAIGINKQTTRILIGATIGLQGQQMVYRAVPAQFRNNADYVVLGALVLYILWPQRPRGTLGDVLDGAAIGVAALAASRVVRLPLPV